MILHEINCSCGCTRAEKLDEKWGNCVKCGAPHDIQFSDYTTHDVEITPLHVIEQRAKEQAYEDMYHDVDMLAHLPYIDWDTCFDIDNITVNIPKEYCVYHDGMWYNPENPKAGVINADAYGKPIRVAI
tara:strand:- start:2175 stop:2561 length:387 start_codon:yes stop_codon:yes gene_type:complete